MQQWQFEHSAKTPCFADNCCGCDPAVALAIQDADKGPKRPYHNPEDPSISRCTKHIREAFGSRGAVLFVPTGTIANCIAIGTFLSPGESVVAADCSHLAKNEGGAVQRLLGASVELIAADENGKISAEALEKFLDARDGAGFPHQPVPKVLSLSNPTEKGFVYSREELQQLGLVSSAVGMIVHIDGARLWNAAAAKGESFLQMLQGVPYSVLCLGGRKAVGGEGSAIIFAEQDDAKLRRAIVLTKSFGALSEASWKIAAAFTALLVADRGIGNAVQANLAAQQLGRSLQQLGREVVFGTNCVYCRLPEVFVERLIHQGYFFYTRFSSELGARFTTSWDTTGSDVERLVSDISSIESIETKKLSMRTAST